MKGILPGQYIPVELRAILHSTFIDKVAPDNFRPAKQITGTHFSIANYYKPYTLAWKKKKHFYQADAIP